MIINYIRKKWFPLLLISLSIWDLKNEVRLLLETFTYTSMIFAIRHHLLAVIILISSPSMLRTNGSTRKTK